MSEYCKNAKPELECGFAGKMRCRLPKPFTAPRIEFIFIGVAGLVDRFLLNNFIILKIKRENIVFQNYISEIRPVVSFFEKRINDNAIAVKSYFEICF